MKKIILKIFVIMISFIFLSMQGWATEENSISKETVEESTLEKSQEEPPKVEEKPTEIKKNETMYVQERCNIRASYSVDSSRVGGLDAGTEVTVLAEYSNGWYKIQYGGEEAYIKAGILRSTPPVIEEPEEDELESTTPPEQMSENQEEVDIEYAELINEIGVLPEVGHNIADIFYGGIVVLTMVLMFGVKTTRK